MSETKPHMGRRIALVRGIRNLTQKELADLINYSQQSISEMEKREELSDTELRELTQGLGVTPDFVTGMNEEALSATVYHVHDQGQAFGPFGTNNINPLEQLLKQVEENKRLYEQLLSSEREKLALVQQTLAELKK